ncbi:Ant1 protein [Saccharomycopsis crataegensis]|uniref:Ant1 protein n=1 Tax=Saccharomycopsis crataegensis TaxID=43959 RepID=A0AAV5QMJ8_9ASCO|nr:Ant1 protein [Saccharomycopsis crataegensis]
MSNVNLSPLEKAAIGSLASVVANTVVYPLDITKTLIQSQQNLKAYTLKEIKENPNLYADSIDCLKKLFVKHGLHGWYFGIVPSLCSTAASNFAYFFWYAIVHKIYETRNPKNKVKSTLVELSLGAVAAALSQVFIMPVSTISTKQQTEISEDGKDNPSFLDTARKIVGRDGITGLWSGLKVSLVLTSNPSITYGTFARLRSLLFNGKQNLSVAQSFSLGVLSKLLATVVTMPLILSKVMIQKKTTVVTEKIVDPTTGETRYVKTQRNFNTFQECLWYVYNTDGVLGLWKGLMPQISKAVIVQGFLFMFKEQLEALFIRLIKLIRLRKKGRVVV